MGNLSKVKRIQLNCSIRLLKENCESIKDCRDCVFCRYIDTEAICTLKSAPASWAEIPEKKGEKTF